jgi:UDP-GlcNAc:undecaprenyl-phosphate GlcNAc-1-phosphate transferase
MKNLYLEAAATFSFSLFATWLLLPKLTDIAVRIGLVDQPNRRKVHKRPKPLIGGVAMVAGVGLSCLLFLHPASLRGFFIGLAILLIVGFLDDFRELNHRLKFLAQFLSMGCLVFLSGVRLETLGELLPGFSLSIGYMVVPLTILSGVGVINAVNMADGLDGLAGGLALTAFASFSFLAHLNGQPNLMLLSLAFCGALIIFLKHNWHPSSLFMGDAGSLTIGFTLAFLSIAISQRGLGLVPPLTILLIMAVPVTDTLTVMTKRMIRKRSPFRADRTHFHHLLLRCGFTKRLSVLTILGISLALSAVGLGGALLNVPHYYLMAAFLGYFGLYLLFVFYATEILRAKLRITLGRPHGSGIIVSAVAFLMERIERKVKVRWEGFQFSADTPAPCILNRAGMQVGGTFKDLSTKGFSITSCESLTLGEELGAGLFLRHEGKSGKVQELDLSVTVELVRTRQEGEEFEYGFRFSNMDRDASQKITRFLSKADIQAAETGGPLPAIMYSEDFAG